MVIYSTTRDKPVLGEIVKMGLCQMLTKGHSMYRGETEKLLQLRSGGIHISSHQHKPPFFSAPPPLLTFFGEWCIIIFATILYWYLDGVMM